MDTPGEAMSDKFHVIEIKSWSYVESPTGTLDGPWRYKWEAQEVADEMNKREATRLTPEDAQ